MSGYEAPYGEHERQFEERKVSVKERALKLPLNALTLGDLLQVLEGLRYTNDWGASDYGLGLIEKVLGKSVQTRRTK